MAAVRGGMRTTALVLAAALAVAACGGSDDDAGSTTSTTAAAPSGPITVDDLADRCDELTPLVEALRGEAPESVDGQAAGPAGLNDFEYRTAHCLYAYEGDTPDDKNRVEIAIDSARDDRQGIQTMFGQGALTEIIEGLGYPATWHLGDGTESSATAQALVDTSIVRIRATAPGDDGAAYLEKPFMTAALAALLPQIAP